MPAAIPDDLLQALDRAPDDERALLELRLTWRGLDDARARIAARLRVFLLTWDPLRWHDRPPARATATGDGDGCEVVLYLPLEQILRGGRAPGADVAAGLGYFAASVLGVGARYEQALVAGAYPQLASNGDAPGLLSELGTLPGLDALAVGMASAEWQPIGLGAIHDLVQEAFGPVDLDRSAVRFPAAVGRPVVGCPACAGEALGFPGDLMDAQDAMCPPHAEQAQAIADERMQRGWKSNRAGMDAILGTSSMLTEPTFGLSLTLLRCLDELHDHRDPLERPSSAELLADSELALSVAARLGGRPERFRALVESDRVPANWLVELPMALADGGLVDEAVAVADAYSELDVANAALFAGDATLILARAGRAEPALARVETNLRRFPRDAWTQVHAGDVHAAVSDSERAEAAFRAALDIARASGDRDAAASAWQRLGELLEGQPGRERDAGEAARRSRLALDAQYGGPRVVPKVGRNDPCPCGSGRKHKRCCGA